MSPHIRVGKGTVNYQESKSSQEQVKTAQGREGLGEHEGALRDPRLAGEVKGKAPLPSCLTQRISDRNPFFYQNADDSPCRNVSL